MNLAQERQIRDVIAGIPGEPLRSALRSAFRAKSAHEGIKLMLDRANEIGDVQRAVLIGTMIDPVSRQRLNDYLDRQWSQGRLRTIMPSQLNSIRPESEVIIGAGAHAAIYCATRAAKARRENKPYYPPLVLEARDRVGGAFAMTKNASFFTNSRNRPGGQGSPGEGGALNLFPNAPLQPFDLSNDEYQTNTAIADVVRLTLAMYARVVPNTDIQSILASRPTDDQTDFQLCRSAAGVAVLTKTDRVIMPLGVGPQKTFAAGVMASDRVFDYWGFMSRMDQPFPLRGMDRVAVIGAGDSGKTIVEALVGMSPSGQMSVASMDWVKRIDWYGVGNTNEATFCSVQQARYRNIGRVFRPDRDGQRVRGFDKASSVVPSDHVVFVEGRPYDHVIVACGSGPIKSPVILGEYQPVSELLAGMTVGIKFKNGFQTDRANGIYRIGPAALLPIEPFEKIFANKIKGNISALFRYAPRTAALAASFPNNAP